MTISTTQIFRQGINAVLDQQEGLSRTQLEIASGKRIQTPSDDPSGAVKSIDIKEQIATAEQHLRNGDFARTELSLEEGAMTGAQNVLQRVRELMIQANNDTQSESTRQGIATEIRARRDELLALANARNASGDFLFAGFKLDSQPFSLSGGSVVYSGDQGQRRIQVGPSSLVPVSDSGVDVFQLIKTGNGKLAVDNTVANTGSGVVKSLSQNSSFTSDTYTLSFIQLAPTDPITYEVRDSSAALVSSGNYVTGDSIAFNGITMVVDGEPDNGDSFTVSPSTNQDVFTTLNNIIAALEAPSTFLADNARLHNDMNEGLENIDRGLDNILRIRSNIGSRLNNLDSQSEVNENFLLRMKSAISEIQDLDFAEAISRLSSQATSLEAAQKVFIEVQGLSLFDFL
ncbi:MAG: flagellar hook-associated protein FlgL [Gammaproteobacteria bacterium]|nr:flagellar hook-associated protein FlgL [Gammaproteobacteria bacterium]MBQ0839514.1 flagellar hook-associated protein FlgL [Gammaproteobacteria bacterium]